MHRTLPDQKGVVPLAPRMKPAQARSQQTSDLIMTATAAVLDEVGFEGLSTNLVCKRAGLTPPALYRYFPNKHALLAALGERLMTAQDEAVLRALESTGLKVATLEEEIEAIYRLQCEVTEITRGFPGSLSVMRAMRSSPALRHVRIISRDMVTDRYVSALRPFCRDDALAQLPIVVRLVTEWGYAATEMVLEEPDREADAVTLTACRMMASAIWNLTGPRS